jgi:transposase
MAGVPGSARSGSAERTLRVDQVHVVRHKVQVEGRSQRAVARELGLSRTTVREYVDQAAAGAEGVDTAEGGHRPAFRFAS